MMPPFSYWFDRWFHAGGGRPEVAPDTGEAGTSKPAPAVVVTGGSAGIGLAIAREFHRRGRTVVLVARDEVLLRVAVASFDQGRGAGSAGVRSLSLDVSEPGAPSALVAALEAEGLYVDVLVNNAGTGLAGRFDTHGADELSALIALNVTALTRLTRHVLPAMVERRCGGILNVASLGGYVPGPHQAAYYASKAYVCSLSEALASELAFSGVRVTVVAPGPVATRFHAAMGADRSMYRLLLPSLTPERTARAAVAGYLWRRTVVVPGLINKVMAVCVSVLPHAATVPFVTFLLARR